MFLFFFSFCSGPVNKKMVSDIFFQHSPSDLPQPKKTDHLASDIFGTRLSMSSSFSSSSSSSPSTTADPASTKSFRKRNSNVSHVFDVDPPLPPSNHNSITSPQQQHSLKRDYLSSDIFHQRPLASGSHTEPLVRKMHRQPKGEITNLIGDPRFSAFKDRGQSDLQIQIKSFVFDFFAFHFLDFDFLLLLDFCASESFPCSFLCIFISFPCDFLSSFVSGLLRLLLLLSRAFLSFPLLFFPTEREQQVYEAQVREAVKNALVFQTDDDAHHI